MPSSAEASKEIKQLYINGHFCYVFKFGILTNGLGIVRNISFLDEEFASTHPEIELNKKSDSPDEDKSISDSKALGPVLSDYFNLHPNALRNTFLGDSAFDTVAIYPFLINECHFQKAVIPINPRNSSSPLPKPEFNESGHPLCPNDNTKPMKPCGWCRGKGRSPRFKWGCPETYYEKGKLVCHCENPCTESPLGRMFYTYPHQDLRLYPGIIRDTDEWVTTYKKRGVIEQTIQYFKDPMAVGNPKTRDKKTIKADLFLAGITQLITLILADQMHNRDCIKSLKSLIA
ncbi:MAG: hypothetical protein ACOX47_04105 [Bacillota bacterium]|jgi:hypothetical protein